MKKLKNGGDGFKYDQAPAKGKKGKAPKKSAKKAKKPTGTRKRMVGPDHFGMM